MMDPPRSVLSILICLLLFRISGEGQTQHPFRWRWIWDLLPPPSGCCATGLRSLPVIETLQPERQWASCIIVVKSKASLSHKKALTRKLGCRIHFKNSIWTVSEVAGYDSVNTINSATVSVRSSQEIIYKVTDFLFRVVCTHAHGQLFFFFFRTAGWCPLGWLAGFKLVFPHLIIDPLLWNGCLVLSLSISFSVPPKLFQNNFREPVPYVFPVLLPLLITLIILELWDIKYIPLELFLSPLTLPLHRHPQKRCFKNVRPVQTLWLCGEMLVWECGAKICLFALCPRRCAVCPLLLQQDCPL